MQLVTGYTGSNHVTANDDSIRNVMLGEFNGRGVFPVFDEFEALAVTANEVRVNSGYGINQGRLFKIDRNDYDSCTIENGSAGLKRVDLIVARYTRDEQTGIEDCELVVIKGTAGSSYADPSYTSGNILNGALQDDMPMYRVKINGVVIEAVEQMFAKYDSLIGGIEPVIDERCDAIFDDKLAGYQAEFQQMIDDDDSAFETWFAGVQAILDEETATKLVNAVAKHDANFSDNVETTTTASKAYAVGDPMICQNNYYRVTSAIAQGDTIAVGTNVERANVSDEIDGIKNTTDNLFDLIYPVGSIYMSVNSTNPSTLFGGTWSAWGSGRVPVGVDTSQTEFNTVEKTGGEVTHTLTINEMPEHEHSVKEYFLDDGHQVASGNDIGLADTNRSTGEKGGSQAHNNLQPYITCYMWKRTA